MLQFLGNIQAKADIKGRIFIPAVFRKRLQTRGGVPCAAEDIFQDCLVLYPGTVWEKRSRLAGPIKQVESKQQQVFRQFVLGAKEEMDTNGRVLIRSDICRWHR